MDGILVSIKKLLGIEEGYTHFDPDIIMHINTYIATLTQIGIGPKEGFTVTGTRETWQDFMGDDPRLESVKTYIYLKARLVFDCPASSTIVEAMKASAAEIEWRLNATAETKEA